MGAESPAAIRRDNMLEFYFSYRGVPKRLRSGVLAGEMDRLAEHFFARSVISEHPPRFTSAGLRVLASLP